MLNPNFRKFFLYSSKAKSFTPAPESPAFQGGDACPYRYARQKRCIYCGLAKRCRREWKFSWAFGAGFQPNKQEKFQPLGRRGFTLIELLVVIAIIGLLSTVVVVNINSARKKARNNAIVANMNSLRQAGELWASDPARNGLYTGFCVSDNCSSAGASPDWKNICLAVKTQNGNQAVTCNINAQNTAWCASTVLTDSTNYCVDSTAKTGTAGGCGAGFVCP